VKPVSLYIITFLALISAQFTYSYPGTSTPNRPYPQHSLYSSGTIKPSGITQQQLDDSTAAFYSRWKARYLRNDCGGDQYYVYDDEKPPIICVSEGQGYGMLITAIMAGYDTAARTYFDGLFRFYRAHPSSINTTLMAWKQITGCISDPVNGLDAATDGDLDIAFGLLLADNQWGSDGPINYRQEALTLIGAIMQDEINPVTRATKLGDWCFPSDPVFYHGTRTSDFMMDHFRVFRQFTEDARWDSVIDRCYALIAAMQSTYSPATGLLPDFIENVNTSPAPATGKYLESVYDGSYSYNACRTPWRITTDYLLSGEIRAKLAVQKLNSWIRSATGGDPSLIRSGYRLNGAGIPGTDYSAESFTGPFAVGAMIDTTTQAWLDDLWDFNLSYNFTTSFYYENTLKLLTMIVISGNWWAPSPAPPPAPLPAAPPDGATRQPLLTTLIWHSVPGASTYHLQVATDSTFTTIFSSDSLLTDTTKSLQFTGSYATYFWRVRAKGSASPGDYSLGWKFRTAIGVPAPAGVSGISTTPHFVWHPVGGAATYALDISSDSLFATSAFIDSTFSDTAAAPAILLPAARYFWRIRAAAPDETGDWSAPSFFDAVTGMDVLSFISSERWNLVSLPLLPADRSRREIFPDAESEAFSFGDGYAPEESLRTGIGYWIKLPRSRPVAVTGTLLTSDTIAVTGGVWNCIGTIADTLDVAGIGSIPPGMITSNFYSYQRGYTASPMLVPGRGYWVKPESDGSLILSAGISLSSGSLIGIFDRGELPPSPPGEAGHDRSEPEGPVFLVRNYPNPFNPETKMLIATRYSLFVRVSIFDLLGREVAMLFEGTLPGGRHTFTWIPGADGRAIPGGVYFCRIRANGRSETTKLLYLK
jgi:endo-1,4-beta-D-glucanase Y